MIKKIIKYTDYNGVERTEEALFNLSKAELIEMEAGVNGGFSKKLQKMVDSQDAPTLMATFKDIILKSYGQMSDDGRRIIKSAALSEEFTQTEAYSELIVELMSDTDKASEFINGILPKMDGLNVPAPTK